MEIYMKGVKAKQNKKEYWMGNSFEEFKYLENQIKSLTPTATQTKCFFLVLYFCLFENFME